ncbi:hypothetical protein C8R46DRAFT_1096098 [Mycena filopes]|nr:hypothetical protein C8R46DRAFT_1096098 [Mycena filopes]
MAEAQRAIAAAQSRQSDAIAAKRALVCSQQEADDLRRTVTSLSASVRAQAQRADVQEETIASLRHLLAGLRARSDGLATERDVHRQHAQAREGRITTLQQRIAVLESSRRDERIQREAERAEMGALEEEVKAGRAELKTERARLTRERSKLAQDKRAARTMVAGLKRDVNALSGLFADEGDEEEDGKEPAASPRKRRKTEGSPDDKEAPHEYPRRARRAAPKYT